MMNRDKAKAEGASRALKKANKRLASALGMQPKHTRRPSKDFELNAKRVEYRQKLLDMRDEETRKAGQPVRRPRLDKTRKRPLSK